jgi:hypothetical protein
VIHINRSSNWIQAEYNNQNAPNTFYTVSSEYAASDLCTLLPIELIDFSAELVNTNDCLIQWKTASEQNNAYFTLEKSVDGTNWKEIATVKGSGNSTSLKKYKRIDPNLLHQITYYRLKQTDFDGQSETSQPIRIEYLPESLIIYPNPAYSEINILNASGDILRIYNSIGRLVCIVSLNDNQLMNTVDLSNYPAGIYLFRTNTQSVKVIKN